MAGGMKRVFHLIFSLGVAKSVKKSDNINILH